MRRRSLLSETNKRAGYITTYSTANTLTYTGNSQLLITSAAGSGTILYSLDNINFSSSIPTAINAGSYTVYYKAAESRFFLESTVYNVSCNISRASGYILTEPTPKSLTYAGSAQTLLNGGNGSGTIYYSLTSNANFSTTIPTGTNAGTYTVYYYAAESVNYTQSSTRNILVSIKKANLSASVSMAGWTYGSTASNPSVSGNSGSGSVTYTYKVSTAADSTYTTTKPSNVGTYTVRAQIAETSNYFGATVTNSFTISQKTVSLSWGTTSWTYDGSAHSTTCTARGLVSGDTCTVTLTGNSITNKGTTTVTASSLSNSNYVLPSAKTATLTINIRTVTVTAPTSTNRTYTGSDLVIFTAGSCTAGGTMYYSETNKTFSTSTWSTSLPYTKKSTAATYTMYYYCYVSDTTNNTGTNINKILSVSAVINKKATNAPVLTSGGTTTYNGTTYYAKAATGSGNPSGTIYYGASSGATTYSMTASTTAANLTSMGRANVGTTTIYAFFKPTDTTNYSNSSVVSTTVTITNKATGSSGSVSNPAAQTYKSSGTYSYQLGISRASGTVTYPTSITVKNSGGTAVSGWSCTSAGVVTVPARTNAGTYTVTGNITVAASTNYNAVGATSKTWTITINKASQAGPTSVSGATVYFHNTATASASGGGGQGTLSWTNGNTRTAVGTTSTSAYWSGNTNYNASAATGPVDLVVKKATDQSVSVTLTNRNYIAGSAQTIASATSHGCTAYYLGFGTSSKVNSWGGAGASLAASNAGTYYIWYKGTADGNHSADVPTTYKGAVTINKINPTITKPTGKTGLSYTGRAQTLVNAGSNTTAGTFKYNLSGGSYSTTLPSATNANTSGYSVGWTFTPNDTTNYNTMSGTLTVKISKAAPSYTAPVGLTLTYSGAAQYLTSTGSTSHGTILYSSNNSSWSTTRCTGTNANSYTTYWRLVGDANHNDVGSTMLASHINRASSAISFSGNDTVEKGKTLAKPAHRTKGDGAITYSSSNTAIATVNGSGTVTGVSVGSCTITVTTAQSTNYNQATATYTLTVTHPTVDLGLPSGNLWASYNLGANSPLEVGNYYSWGTLTGYSASSGHNWGTGNDTSPYSSVAARNQTTALTDAQDAARLNWGTSWKMPTEEDRVELFLNCTCYFGTYSGVKAIRLVSKKNSNQLYIPAGGWLKSTSVQQNSETGRYWLRDVGGTPKEQGKNMYFRFSDNTYSSPNAAKYLACPIRAINIEHVAY